MQRDPLDRPGMRAQAMPLGGTTDRVDSGTAFNPALSVILDGVYYNGLNNDFGDPAGFGGHDHDHGHGHGHGHDHGLDDGFNLRETEIALSGSVDNYLDAMVTLAIDEHDIEVEEAWFATRSLPAGLQLKGGKFLSDIGYINKQHPHDWDFVDRPLVNAFLFGDHGLQEKGLQLSWVPATPFYSRYGVEVLQGESEGFATTDDGLVSESSGPRLFTAFAKFAPDLGYDHALQFGLSYGYARQVQEVDDHGNHAHALEGDSWFAGSDLVYKYDAGRPYGHGDVRLQAEYFWRQRNVDEYVEHGSGRIEKRDNFRERQDGLYLQGIYGFAPRWEAGARFEALGLTNRAVDYHPTELENHDTSYRYGLVTTWRPTEFSYFRAQANYVDFADEGHGHDHDHGNDRGWELMLQYNISLGVHGAHQF
ncbi:TonB-dependent receptor [Alkalilimnicola ehrlichii]|uniref:TonB-dependent receptor n=1 Tax=Alkalilimnicola ehrlichii TaxID=351052 RepID=UPI003BA01413